MCKLCEKENSEMIVDNELTYCYIMNNIDIHPEIVYGSRNGAAQHVQINYCPFCGTRLVNVEDFYVFKNS